MPSPFPGMDPYLEDPALWPDVHHQLISEFQGALNRILRPNYVVRIDGCVYESDQDDPGRAILAPGLRAEEEARTAKALRELDVAKPMEITTVWTDEISESQLRVIEQRSQETVTLIELLSPANKAAGSHGRASYLKRRRETLRSPLSWVEIDLLREGIPILPPEVCLRSDYMVHVSWPQQRPRAKVWPILLRQRLPKISIPLRHGDPDVELDLQEAIGLAYEHAAYDLTIDYRQQPTPPLKPEDAAWAERLLRDKGLRSLPAN